MCVCLPGNIRSTDNRCVVGQVRSGYLRSHNKVSYPVTFFSGFEHTDRRVRFGYSVGELGRIRYGYGIGISRGDTI